MESMLWVGMGSGGFRVFRWGLAGGSGVGVGVRDVLLWDGTYCWGMRGWVVEVEGEEGGGLCGLGRKVGRGARQEGFGKGC